MSFFVCAFLCACFPGSGTAASVPAESIDKWSWVNDFTVPIRNHYLISHCEPDRWFRANGKRCVHTKLADRCDNGKKNLIVLFDLIELSFGLDAMHTGLIAMELKYCR